MCCQILFTQIHLDTGNDPCLLYYLNKGCAVACRLPNRLIIEDDATNELIQAGRRDDHFTIFASVLLTLQNSGCFKSLVAGGVALIHRQKPTITLKKRPYCIDKAINIHDSGYLMSPPERGVSEGSRGRNARS